jgi:hypothetical protein
MPRTTAPPIPFSHTGCHAVRISSRFLWMALPDGDDYDHSQRLRKQSRTRGATAMRYVAMQVLTWGTIAGAIGSALLLTTLESTSQKYFAVGTLEPPVGLSVMPSPTARPQQGTAPSLSASRNHAAGPIASPGR